MSDFFGGLRTGIKMPEVVWNQGPLPSAGGLPAPLHEMPDARINYNSSLLGDLTPYAYGEPGYLSSQSSYLNIPHKIPKIVPVVYLPEAKAGATEFFDLTHPVDDGDVAFVLRLNRSSLFCTGLRNGDMRRAGLGTAIDPLVNLPTFNYILSGLQLGMNNDGGNLWKELFHNLDPSRFRKERDYSKDAANLDDVIHIVRHCIKPFGIVRGSEKQGGQDQATLAPATWPVSFIVSLTIDGKESNVLNIWHHRDLSAGDDLVLRLKLMPVRPYTLNHYYKGIKTQNWGLSPDKPRHIWQLVPALMDLQTIDTGDIRSRSFDRKEKEALRAIVQGLEKPLKTPGANVRSFTEEDVAEDYWQNLGYWHVGRSQIMTGKYGEEEYWHNDLANMLKTNHLDITFQPMFCCAPKPQRRTRAVVRAAAEGRAEDDEEGWDEKGWGEVDSGMRGRLRREPWTARLQLELLQPGEPSWDATWQMLVEPPPPEERLAEPEPLPEEPLAAPAPLPEVAPQDIGPHTLLQDKPEEELDVPAPGLGPKRPAGQARPAKRRVVGGSLLKADGTSEPSLVGML